MRKFNFLLILSFLIFGLSNLSSATGKVRPYGALGYGLGGFAGYEETSYIPPYYSPGIGRFSWGLGVQGLFEVAPAISLGVDLGYSHFGWADSMGSNYVDANFFNILGLAEFNIGKLFFIQGGLGVYLDSVDYPTGAPEKLGSSFGLLLAPGLDIPVSKSVSIPIMARFDVIFAKEIGPAVNNVKNGGTLVMMRIMSGVTVKF